MTWVKYYQHVLVHWLLIRAKLHIFNVKIILTSFIRVFSGCFVGKCYKIILYIFVHISYNHDRVYLHTHTHTPDYKCWTTSLRYLLGLYGTISGPYKGCLHALFPHISSHFILRFLVSSSSHSQGCKQAESESKF